MNLTQIVISDAISMYLLLVLVLEARFEVLMGEKEGGEIRYLIYATMLSSGLDLLVSLVDGRPGRIFRLVNYYGNNLLYITPVLIIWHWLRFIRFLRRELYETEEEAVRRIGILSILQIPSAMMLGLALLQVFYPVLFMVDENNVYHRLPMSWYAVFNMLFYVAAGFIYFYILGKDRFRKKKVLFFLAPIIGGTFLQFLVPGISTIYSSVTVGLVCFYISCNNELMFRDWLTGLLNRTCYLSGETQGLFPKYRRIGMLMMDLDDFKGVNDQHGHAEGDRALQILAGALKKEADWRDLVFRLAGDEFLVITFSEEEDYLDCFQAKVRERLDHVCSGMPYQIRVTGGSAWKEEPDRDMDSILKRADAAMYRVKAGKKTGEGIQAHT